MKILVTAFDPFGGESVNPALEALKRLPNQIQGQEIYKLQVPTVFHKSAQVLKARALELQPDVIVCLGQAGGRSQITPERVAINQDDGRISDNEGNQPIDQPIQADGPPAYFSTLPIKAIVARLWEAGLPAAVSNSAGTFVCNHLMYQALYLADYYLDNCQAGFIHIPYLPSQVLDKPGQASMSLDDIVRGLILALETIIDHGHQPDYMITGGSLH